MSKFYCKDHGFVDQIEPCCADAIAITPDSDPTIDGKVATLIFDELSIETYFGLNMKITMMSLPIEELETIDRFIKLCKESRKGLKF